MKSVWPLVSGVDNNIRYLPILRDLIQHLPESILEVGSGPTGIARYLNQSVTGVDTAFVGTLHPNLIPVQLSGTRLPFEANSFDTVVSTDMLEHVPPENRLTTVEEMMRVCKKRLYLAVPTGHLSEEHDKRIDVLYEKYHNHQRHPFLVEHVTNGLPATEFVATTLESAAQKFNKRLVLRQQKNYSLWLREIELGLWAYNHRWSDRLLNYTKGLSVFTDLLSVGNCYRVIFFAEVK
jgi:SAM-dependent methyltransferase